MSKRKVSSLKSLGLPSAKEMRRRRLLKEYGGL